ncbi:MAG: orotate phosphoribosyltransferase [Nitrosotalea sp.]
MMELVDTTQQREHLKQLIIKTEAFKRYEKPVKLSSGKLSNLYFDIKKLTGLPEGINVVAELLYDEIMQIGGIESVGGLEAGSIAIATAISQVSHIKNKDTALQSFWVRKEPKPHGLQKWIEGCVKSPTVVVDDVITTGDSALKAIEKLREEHHTVDYIFTVVYRGTEEERHKIEAKHKIKLRYIFSEADFSKP